MNVSEYSFPELPEEIALLILKFENLSCAFRIVEDSDEIFISLDVGTDGFVNRKLSSFWTETFGKNIMFAWELTNNQGYRDGLQLEFTENSLTIQFLVVASSLRLYKIEQVSK